MISIFIGGTVYHKRKHLFPLLKPFVKGTEYSDDKRIALYHISENEISFVDTMKEASYVVLPMSWNFYLSQNSLEEAEEIIQKAKTLNKTVLTFMVGDFGVKIPKYENVKVYRHSGDKSKLNKNHLGLPAFIDDPLQKIFKTDVISVRTYTEKPTIGFCGQANSTWTNALRELVATIARNMNSALGLSKAQPQQIVSTSFLRASVLKLLEQSELLKTNFIYRKQYRAGATTPEMRQKTTTEFYENIRDSDYVVCVRGAGNFSVRFYETLAMGRIPVFINTDCLLPLEATIPWKQHVVWVPYTEKNNIARHVATFHASLTSKQFEHLQQENRSLWKEKLTLGGFFKSHLNARR